MAVTADQVEVRLRADTAQYVRNLQQADAAFSKTADGIAVSSARANAATNNLSLNTGNIAAQFQDIGVTAAAGMNPLIIALQQGTQLSAVLNESVSRGVSPARALGSAFLQVINPISLATIATIALGTAAIQYFGTLISKAGPASESLKEQNDRIREVADRWGEAVPALQAYVDQLERAEERGQLETAVGDLVARQFDGLRAQLPEIRAELGAAFQDLANDEAENGIRGIFDAVTELERKVQDNTATSADLDRVLALLAATSATQTVPSLANLQLVLSAVAGQLAAAAAQAANFQRDLVNLNAARIRANAQEGFATREFVAEQERLNGLTAGQLQLENEVARVKAQATRDGATALTEAQALAIATDNIAAAERRRAEAAAIKSGGKALTELERERQAVVELIEQLEFEFSLIGATNAEREVANALRQAGAAATESQRARIEELTRATLDEQAAIEELNRTSQEWADTIQSATRGFIDDLIEGKSAAEAFGNVLSDIGSRFIDLGLNSLFGGSGFNLAGLFGGTPTRATGGPVYAGNPTLVGERGPEVFVPSGPGRIVPNSQVGGSSVTFAPVIDARGADVAAVARLEQSMQRLAADIVPAIRREIATTGKKGRTRG